MVRGVAGVVGEEHQVAGDQVRRVHRAHAGVGGELGPRDPRDGDPGGGVGEAGQPRAVEGAGALGAPHVGGAELGQGGLDRLGGRWGGAAVPGRGGAGGPGRGQVAGEGGPLGGFLAASLLLDEGGHAAVHGAELALDVGGQALGLGPFGVELLGAAGLVDQALGEAGAGAVEPLLGPGDPVDQGQVGVEHGALQRQPGQGVGRVVGADQVGHEPAGAGHVAAAGPLVQLGLGGGHLALGRLAAAVQLGGLGQQADPAGVRLLQVLGQHLQPPVLAVELGPQPGRPGPQRAQVAGRDGRRADDRAGRGRTGRGPWDGDGRAGLGRAGQGGGGGEGDGGEQGGRDDGGGHRPARTGAEDRRGPSPYGPVLVAPRGRAGRWKGGGMGPPARRRAGRSTSVRCRGPAGWDRREEPDHPP